MQQKKYPFHIYISIKILAPFLRIFNALKDIGDLTVRCWIAKIFLMSGLSKIVDWDTTLVLFKYDYHVPLISPAIAAYMGTGAEFLLPILLVFGFGGRFIIFAFFIYNVICVASFSLLWTPTGAAGLSDHVNWGLLLMMLMFHGSGRLSLDHLLHKRYGHLLHMGINKKILWTD